MGRVFVVYCTLAVLLASAKAEPKAQGPSAGITVSLGDEHACLSEFNATRKAAGLSEFAVPTDPKTQKLPDKDQLQTWEPVCDYLLGTPKTKYARAANPFPSGTYAYLSLENEKPDCIAAVKQMQNARKNFSGLPPKKSYDEPLYKSQENVSLVALYNPSENATADCQVVTCTKTEAKDAGDGKELEEEGKPEVETQPDDKRPAGKTVGWALVCLTTPDAFAGEKAPFTQAQWDGVSTAIKSSALAVVPAIAVAFAAASISIGALF